MLIVSRILHLPTVQESDDEDDAEDAARASGAVGGAAGAKVDGAHTAMVADILKEKEKAEVRAKEAEAKGGQVSRAGFEAVSATYCS